MDWVAAVSLTVGGFSIILAAFAMVISTLNYERTKDVLAEISKQAAVIEGTVRETQSKLVDTVTSIAKPKEETQEDKLLGALLPSMVNNPQLLEQMIRLGEQQGKSSP